MVGRLSDTAVPVRPARIDDDVSLNARFERVVRIHADRLALADGGGMLRYRDLDQEAARVARVIGVHRGRPGDRVAVLMPHGAEQIAAALGVFKAGCVLVVLNLSDPPSRLQAAIDEAEPTVVLAGRGQVDFARQFARTGRAVADAGGNAEALAPVEPARGADDLAVLTFTSGTTGRPRAVMQTHGRLLDSTRRLTETMGLTCDDRVPLLAAMSGGNGLGIALSVLFSGASLWPFATMERGVTGLADFVDASAITVFSSSSSLFRSLMRAIGADRRLSGIRLVRLSSEPATSRDVAAFRRHFPAATTFVHTLSSSETGNIAVHRIARDEPVGEGRLPIGRPANGVEIALLDAKGRPVPAGEAGEIVVSGFALAAGYWRNPALTAARFATAADGKRVVHTGDLGRRRPDGLIEMVGRIDARLKIRGFRIEPSEVEAAVLGLPGIASAAVCARERPSLEPLLVAFITRDGPAMPARAMRDALRAVLPEHMVPSAFVDLREMPLTAHGKIDRERLLLLDLPVSAGAAAAPPRGDSEIRVASFWADALSLTSVGRSDDFFALGGDSLAAAVVAANVHQAFGVELDLGLFADHPTLAEFARAVDERCAASMPDGVPPLAARPRDVPAPLSLFQERIWTFSQTAEGSAGYTVANCDDLEGPLDRAILSACLDDLFARHDILRTTIVTVAGRPVQIAAPPAPVPLPLHDVAATRDPEGAAQAIYRAEAARPFDLARGPLMRFALIRLRADRHWLICINHHIISDGWSRRILLRELALLYEARHAGEAPALPVGPLQYADFAAWQQANFGRASAAFAARIAWWRDLITVPPIPPPIEPPVRRIVPAPRTDPALGRLTTRFEPDTTLRLAALARTSAATDFVVHLAGFAALLSVCAGQRDFAIGTYVSNRNRVALQGMFGCFINLATLRFACDPARSFRAWLGETRRLVIAAETRADIPHDQLAEELRARGAAVPKIAVIFSDSSRRDRLSFGGLTLTRMARGEQTMPWGFSVYLDEQDGRQRLRSVFDAGRYDPDAVRAFMARLVRFIDAAAREPDRSLTDLAAAAG